MYARRPAGDKHFIFILTFKNTLNQCWTRRAVETSSLALLHPLRWTRRESNPQPHHSQWCAMPFRHEPIRALPLSTRVAFSPALNATSGFRFAIFTCCKASRLRAVIYEKEVIHWFKNLFNHFLGRSLSTLLVSSTAFLHLSPK